MGTGMLYLIPLVMLLAVGGWLLHSVVTAITRPKKGVREPSCEKCRYPVAGLAELRCPECGADLRASGIITPAMEARRRGSTVKAILAFTALWFLVSQFMALPIAVATRSGGTVSDGIVAVGMFLGWVTLGGGLCVGIVRRRRRLLEEGEGSRPARDGMGLALAQWVLLWLGGGMLLVFPVCGYLFFFGRELDNDRLMLVASVGFAVAWGILGVLVGSRIVRRYRRATPGSPDAHNGAA